MSTNGDARIHILEVIDTLVLPNSLDKESQELIREQWRDDPSPLDALLDVDELYQFIIGTEYVSRDTKECVISGLERYIGVDGNAYAALVGLYLVELSEIISDKTGFQRIFNELERFELILVDRY